MKTYTRTTIIHAEQMTFGEYIFQEYGETSRDNGLGWFVVAQGQKDRWIDDATFKSLGYVEQK